MGSCNILSQIRLIRFFLHSFNSSGLVMGIIHESYLIFGFPCNAEDQPPHLLMVVLGVLGGISDRLINKFS